MGDGARRGGTPPPWAYVGLGFEIAAPVVLGLYVGYRVDRAWGTAPWAVVAGALLGIAMAFYLLFRSVNRGGGGA